MSKHKRQHYVPSTYLAAWIDPNTPTNRQGYVWLFEKDGSASRNKSPDNILNETDFYTIMTDEGVRDLRIEHGLGAIESDFKPARDRLVAKDWSRFVDDLAQLLNFAASIKVRTKAVRDHHRSQWSEPLKLLDELAEKMKNATPAQHLRMSKYQPIRSGGPSLTHEEVRALHDFPLQNTLTLMFEQVLNGYVEMQWALLFTDDELGFITSDNPCAWFDAECVAFPAPWNQPRLSGKSLEVSLPLAPNCCLFLNRKGFSGVRDVPITYVDEINRRTRFKAHRHFIARHNRMKEFWFYSGEPRPDTATDNT